MYFNSFSSFYLEFHQLSLNGREAGPSAADTAVPSSQSQPSGCD
jgi:hypothetical protein